MKKIISNFPTVSRFVLAGLLFVVALVASGWIEKAFHITRNFPFVSIIFLIAGTWILYKTDNKSLKAIGLNVTVKHILFLLLGLIIGAVAFGIVIGLRSIYTGEEWHIRSVIDSKEFLRGLYFILPSVIVQELIFRGYLFTKTIEKTTVVKANIIFAILFMLVHVLDRDVLKNPSQVIVLAVSIPVGHLLFATGLLRARTLFFPIGLHWGNNWATNFLVNQANSHSILYTDQKQIGSWFSFIVILLIFNGFYLLLTFLILKKKKKQSTEIKSGTSLSPL